MEKRNTNKIYLSSPFFNPEEKNNVLKTAEFLRGKGYEVFVPMEHVIKDSENMRNDLWGERVFWLDCNGLKCSDIVVVLDYGFTSDAGTAWEAGYAYASGKIVYLVSLAKDSSKIHHSLMMVNGCSKFFCSMEEFFKYIESGIFKYTADKIIQG